MGWVFASPADSAGRARDLADTHGDASLPGISRTGQGIAISKTAEKRPSQLVVWKNLDITQPPATTIDRGHGRVEKRVVRTTTVLNVYVDWPHLGQAFRIDRHVTDLDGSHPRDEVPFGITDLTPQQADAVRWLAVWLS